MPEVSGDDSRPSGARQHGAANRSVDSGTGGQPPRLSRAEANQETDIFKLSPVARAFPGQILLGVIFIGLAIGLAIRAQDFSWPRWVALVPLALGVLLLLLLWIRVKSCSYRLTTQRLFVRRGWLAKHVNELELYRVKDVVVDQGGPATSAGLRHHHGAGRR